MLFHIKQTHEPQDCPYGAGGSPALFDRDAPDITLHGFWLAFPQHTVYFVVETSDISAIHSFLKPGVGRTMAEITPVSDRPAA
jgi:hypothetical protein